jgi:hypothetical protein
MQSRLKCSSVFTEELLAIFLSHDKDWLVMYWFAIDMKMSTQLWQQ